MKKYVISEEQLIRLERVHALLAREIRFSTNIVAIKDSADLVDHLNNIANTLVEDNTTEYDLRMANGGRFVWEPPKKSTNINYVDHLRIASRDSDGNPLATCKCMGPHKDDAEVEAYFKSKK